MPHIPLQQKSFIPRRAVKAFLGWLIPWVFFSGVFFHRFFEYFVIFYFLVSRRRKKTGRRRLFFAMVPYSVVTVGASKEIFVFRQSFQRAGTSKKRRNNE